MFFYVFLWLVVIRLTRDPPRCHVTRGGRADYEAGPFTLGDLYKELAYNEAALAALGEQRSLKKGFKKAEVDIGDIGDMVSDDYM